MLIDSHVHLQDERYDRDRERLINSFKRDGVELVIASGSSVASSVKAVSLAGKYPQVYATVGIHPNNTDIMDEETIDVIRELAGSRKVVAIGECGLDYHYDYSPKHVQKKWFVEQVRLAKELGLPVVVHDREANIDTYNLLKSEFDSRLKGVLHCYSGDVELAKRYIAMGFYISIAGPVTYSSARKLKEVAKQVPLEYLFVETDGPSLTPGPLGKRRNEPAFVRYVASAVAELKGIPYEKVAQQTTQNVKKLYGIK